MIDQLKDLQQSGDAFTLLDVRTQSEWDDGYIEGAQHVPLHLLPLKKDELPADTDQLIICYCATGSRSAHAAQLLERMGYNNTANLIGGYEQYKRET